MSNEIKDLGLLGGLMAIGAFFVWLGYMGWGAWIA